MRISLNEESFYHLAYHDGHAPQRFLTCPDLVVIRTVLYKDISYGYSTCTLKTKLVMSSKNPN